jgi:hypothetical protein
MPSPAFSPAPSPWLLVGFVVAALLVVAIFAVPLWVMEARAPVRSREERAVDLVRDLQVFERSCDEVGLFVDDDQGKRMYPERFSISPVHRGGYTTRPRWGEIGIRKLPGWSREEMEKGLERLVDDLGSERVQPEICLVGAGAWRVRLDEMDGVGEFYDD